MQILIIIAIIAVALTIMDSLFLLLKTKKKLFFAITGGLFCIGIAGVLIYNLVFYNNSDNVTIKNSEEIDISVKIKNHLLNYEYYFAQFSSNLPENEVLDAVALQYGNAFYDNEYKQIVFSHENQLYTIHNYENSKFLWSNRYKYWLSNNFITITNDGGDYNIPVPLKALDESVETRSSVRKINCDFEDFSAYYKNLNNATIGEDNITLAYDGYDVVITISNNRDMTVAIAGSSQE